MTLPPAPGERQLTVNGEPAQVPEGTTVSDLLRRAGRDPAAHGVAVAVNGAVVRRALWEETLLHGGDEVEVITASQGG